MKALRLFYVLLALLCTACGGGGGGDSSSTSATTNQAVTTQSFPIRQIYGNFLNTVQTVNFTISGKTSNIPVSGSGTTSFFGLSDAIFESAAARMSQNVTTATITVNGITRSLTTGSYAYLNSDYSELGAKSDSSYSVASPVTKLPDSIKVGDSGVWSIEAVYVDSTKTSLAGYGKVTYIVLPDTSNSVLLRLTTSAVDTNGTPSASTTVTTMRVLSDGSLKYVSQDYVSSTTQLTFTY